MKTTRNVLLFVWMALFSQSLFASGKYSALIRTELDSVTVDSLLLKISHVEKNISYSGIVERTTWHAGKPMQLRWRVYHWAPEQTLVSFLAPEALQNTTVFHDGTVYKSRGDKHVARSLHRSTISRSLQDGQLLEEIELLSQNYHISIRAAERYLQRPVLELEIEPKNDARPAYYAKVDAETGLLLETRRLPAHAASDSTAQISRFVEIEYGAPPASLKDQQFTTVDSIRWRRKSQRFDDMAALIGYYRETLLIPGTLPKGFALRRIRAFQKDDKSFVHLHYSDGLSTLSFFQRKNGDSFRRKNAKWGKGSSHLNMLQGEKGGIHYHFVGEISVAELDEMAANLVPITRKTERTSTVVLYILIAILLISGFYFAKRFREKSNV